jgi:phosphohistidine phosphatase
VIVRHAKAARVDAMPDRERPLTPRGHADAGAAGAWLARSGYRPDLVLCSPARRTRETWHDVALAFPSAITIRYDDELYASGAGDLLDLVSRLGDDVGTAVLVGHNPAVSALSELLDPVDADEEGLRTCGIAVHTVDGAWTAYRPQGARLTATYTARA